MVNWNINITQYYDAVTKHAVQNNATTIYDRLQIYHWQPIISCYIKIQIGLTFLMLAYPGCHENEAIKWVSVCLILSQQLHWQLLQFMTRRNNNHITQTTCLSVAIADSLSMTSYC